MLGTLSFVLEHSDSELSYEIQAQQNSIYQARCSARCDVKTLRATTMSNTTIAENVTGSVVIQHRRIQEITSLILCFGLDGLTSKADFSGNKFRLSWCDFVDRPLWTKPAIHEETRTKHEQNVFRLEVDVTKAPRPMTIYSYRNATSGSTLVAFRAGT